MGRRNAPQEKSTGFNTSAAYMVVASVGFALEVAMIAAFVYWGFAQNAPWNLVLGLGVPALVVVLWGVFMAPRSERRLPEGILRWVALGIFLVAGLALIAANSLVLGMAMLVASVGYFIAERALARS